MDQYTVAELSSFMYVAWEDLDRQFYFWVSITFAVIVAAFVADDRLTPPLRYLVSMLYLMATLVLLMRYMMVLTDIAVMRAYLEEADAVVSGIGLGISASLMVILRLILFWPEPCRPSTSCCAIRGCSRGGIRHLDAIPTG